MTNYSITHEDNLYRRVPNNNSDYWKELNGIKMPSSFAFKTRIKGGKMEDGLSVNIAALTTPKESVEKYPNESVAEIPASVPINAGYNCIHKPSKLNYAHAIIEGDTKYIAKELSKTLTQVFHF